MTIKTVKDAELAIRKIQDTLDNLSGGRSGVGGRNTTIIQKQELPSSLRILLAELDIVEDGAMLVHQAYHRFDKDVDMLKAYVRDQVINADSEMAFVFNSATPDVSVYWQNNILMQFIGGASSKIVQYVDVHPEQDDITNFGTATERYKEGWINILNSVTGNFDDVVVSDTLDVNGVVTFLNLTASLPVKTNGVKELISAAIDLASAEVTGILAVANGGTGASTAPYYTKVEVDALLANKSDVGHTHTGVISSVSGHTHGGVVPSDGVHGHTIVIT